MKLLLKLFLFVLIVFSLSWFALYRYSSYKLEYACADWPVINRNLGELSRVIPKKDEGSEVLQVRNNFKEIREIFEEIQLDKLNKQEVADDPLDSIRNYVEKELEKPSEDIALPSPEVLIILDKIKEPSGRIQDILINAPLSFGINVEMSPTETIPNFIVFRDLNRILLARALTEIKIGNIDDGWHSLRASARITESLLRHPMMLTQMIAVPTGIDTLLCLRKMVPPFPPWTKSWPDIDLKKGMLLGFTVEARSWLKMAEESDAFAMLEMTNELIPQMGMEPIKLNPAIKIGLTIFEDHYLRLIATHCIERDKKLIQILSVEDLCSRNAVPSLRHLDSAPRWIEQSFIMRPLVDITNESIGERHWKKLRHLLVYKSGTAMILSAKTTKSESLTKTWPPSLPENDALCPSFPWKYAVEWDGTATFQYEGPMVSEIQKRITPGGHLQFHGNH